MKNCYLTEQESVPEHWRQEFEGEAFDVWIEGLAARGELAKLVGLALGLERLCRTPLTPARRMAVMQRYAPAVRELAERLARRRGRARGPRRGRGRSLSLEQRLACLSVRNLKVTLKALDGKQGGQVAAQESARLWVLMELFEWLGRQVEIWAYWDMPPPDRTWQELHDLYAYYLDRVRPGLDPSAEGEIAGSEYRFGLAYKRLLLLGLLADLGAVRLLHGQPPERLADWVEHSSLGAMGSETGRRDSYLVEMSRDGPPRRNLGAPDSVRRAMVLRVPRELASALEAAAKGKPVFLKA